jgi:hypothetical protein
MVAPIVVPLMYSCCQGVSALIRKELVVVLPQLVLLLVALVVLQQEVGLP